MITAFNTKIPSSTPKSGGISATTIILGLGVLAIGYYFYNEHKKKKELQEG